MTTSLVSVTNRALQLIGTRTTIASLSEQSNEAIQASLVIEEVRDEITRLAPWNCATNWNNLTYITSAPGTPENPSEGTDTWQKGIPAPPWSYEYQYPVDCLRPLWIVPQFITGFAGGIPITTAVTGGGLPYWNGPPVRFKVAIDQFFAATAVAISASNGSGHAVGDLVTLDIGTANFSGTGAPAVIRIDSVSGGGVVTGCSIVSNVIGETRGGSYFTLPINPVPQGSTTGSGIGAKFTLTMQASQADQRVILTGQESAICCYLRQISDPNILDPLFIQAWVSALAGRLAFALSGDKSLANLRLSDANNAIVSARTADGNEGLTINDVTPDWIRVRGFCDLANGSWSPYGGFDWGPTLSLYS